MTTGEQTHAWRVRMPTRRSPGRGLGATDPDGVVIAVDFPATGRPDAGFPALVENMGTGHMMWETVPPPAGTTAGMTGNDYLDHWRAGLRDAPPVTAVFGYCASSVFAVAVAGMVADAGLAGPRGQRPRTLLFDPTSITPATVLEYGFRPALSPFTDVLGAQRTEAARAAGRAASTATGSLAELSSALVGVYRDVAVAAFAELGLDAARSDELVGWFAAYLDYLVAAGSVPVGDLRDLGALGHIAVLRSEDLPEAMELDAEERRFAVDHTELLGSPAVAESVVELLQKPLVGSGPRQTTTQEVR